MSETTSGNDAATRRVLLLAHMGRDDARDVARSFCKALAANGIVVRLLADEARDLELDPTLFDPRIETAVVGPDVSDVM